jgi:hypothetical protein
MTLLQFSGLTHQVRSNLFFPLVELCWVLCAVFGLVAALRIYNHWQIQGRIGLNILSEVVGWISAALFFLIARVFIRLTLNI